MVANAILHWFSINSEIEPFQRKISHYENSIVYKFRDQPRILLNSEKVALRNYTAGLQYVVTVHQ
jgi:hypothetical protein